MSAPRRRVPPTTKIGQQPIPAPIEDPDRWRNRRRMTWVAVIVGLVFYPFCLLVCGGLFPNAGKLVESVQVSLYSLIGGIVLSYFGGVTAEDIVKKMQNRSQPNDKK